MTKLDPTMPPESGKGSDSDRLSMSPQSIRRGGADPTDIGQGDVQLGFDERNYDANPRQGEGTDPWATGTGSPSAP